MGKVNRIRVYVLTEDYLQPLYESLPTGEYIFIDASVFPSEISLL